MFAAGTLRGRATVRKILAAAEKLPRNHIPDGVPATLSDWLVALRLRSYIANFEHSGYGDADLPMIEGSRHPPTDGLAVP